MLLLSWYQSKTSGFNEPTVKQIWCSFLKDCRCICAFQTTFRISEDPSVKGIRSCTCQFSSSFLHCWSKKPNFQCYWVALLGVTQKCTTTKFAWIIQFFLGGVHQRFLRRSKKWTQCRMLQLHNGIVHWPHWQCICPPPPSDAPSPLMQGFCSFCSHSWSRGVLAT